MRHTRERKDLIGVDLVGRMTMMRHTVYSRERKDLIQCKTYPLHVLSPLLVTPFFLLNSHSSTTRCSLVSSAICGHIPGIFLIEIVVRSETKNSIFVWSLRCYKNGKLRDLEIHRNHTTLTGNSR
jgi:hypothetical protein